MYLSMKVEVSKEGILKAALGSQRNKLNRAVVTDLCPGPPSTVPHFNEEQIGRKIFMLYIHVGWRHS